ncbi:Bgt-20645, partial [Blumeria graminis f. sp. tritici]
FPYSTDVYLLTATARSSCSSEHNLQTKNRRIRNMFENHRYKRNVTEQNNWSDLTLHPLLDRTLL